MGSYRGLGGLPFDSSRRHASITGSGLNRLTSPAGSTLAEMLGIPAKRKVFVSYHHHGDQYYKNELMRMYCTEYDLLEDNSLERAMDTDDLKYVEREIREEYIKGASATVVLCGINTWQRKFVDWETCATLLKRAALVGVRLPGCTVMPWRLFDNYLSGYAVVGEWHQITSTPGILRGWIEDALKRDARRADNSRPKMRANGQKRQHPIHG